MYLEDLTIYDKPSEVYTLPNEMPFHPTLLQNEEARSYIGRKFWVEEETECELVEVVFANEVRNVPGKGSGRG